MPLEVVAWRDRDRPSRWRDLRCSCPSPSGKRLSDGQIHPLIRMSQSSRGSRVAQPRLDLDAEIAAMVDRVRQVFGDEILAGIYDRAQNAAIRQPRASDTPAWVPNDGRLRRVSNVDDDGFVRALRDELDRALTHH